MLGLCAGEAESRECRRREVEMEGTTLICQLISKSHMQYEKDEASGVLTHSYWALLTSGSDSFWSILPTLYTKLLANVHYGPPSLFLCKTLLKPDQETFVVRRFPTGGLYHVWRSASQYWTRSLSSHTTQMRS